MKLMYTQGQESYRADAACGLLVDDSPYSTLTLKLKPLVSCYAEKILSRERASETVQK